MPRFDGTGPQGSGPMTGRAQGYCATSRSSNGQIRGYAGYPGSGVGRFLGRLGGMGRRLGRGIRRGRVRRRW